MLVKDSRLLASGWYRVWLSKLRKAAAVLHVVGDYPQEKWLHEKFIADAVARKKSYVMLPPTQESVRFIEYLNDLVQ